MSVHSLGKVPSEDKINGLVKMSNPPNNPYESHPPHALPQYRYVAINPLQSLYTQVHEMRVEVAALTRCVDSFGYKQVVMFRRIEAAACRIEKMVQQKQRGSCSVPPSEPKLS
ncbi:hypothetical protein FXO38_13900 [Capsicum annuum]|nr:hypothetical protein FXO38_13900 [Capsicum annuum]